MYVINYEFELTLVLQIHGEKLGITIALEYKPLHNVLLDISQKLYIEWRSQWEWAICTRLLVRL